MVGRILRLVIRLVILSSPIRKSGCNPCPGTGGRPGAEGAAWALLAGVFALAGCAGIADKPATAGKDAIQVYWPMPPDQPRFKYEFRLRSPSDIEETTEEQRLKQLLAGAPATTEPAFQKPIALAARQGRIYVADSVGRTVIVFDVPRRKVFRFGLREPGSLAKPADIAIDDQLQVYVVDATYRRVFVYDNLGLFLRHIGGPGDLERPTGVAVDRDGGRIYVIDRASNESERHRVVIYGRDGQKLSELGRRGEGEGEFNVPLQAAVGSDGTLYVLDAGNFRVQAFSPDGRFLRAFGKVGNQLGNIARPRGIAIDAQDNLYVTDANFGNFQVFNREGQLLMAVGTPGIEDRPGRFGLVSGIAVDETGRVYVADQLFNKIEVYRPVPEDEARKVMARDNPP